MKKDQRWFWSREWQVAEKEAEADIETGRVSEFNSADEAIAALHKYINDGDTIGDELDPMHGDYPEVLHEGKLP